GCGSASRTASGARRKTPPGRSSSTCNATSATWWPGSCPGAGPLRCSPPPPSAGAWPRRRGSSSPGTRVGTRGRPPPPRRPRTGSRPPGGHGQRTPGEGLVLRPPPGEGGVGQGPEADVGLVAAEALLEAGHLEADAGVVAPRLGPEVDPSDGREERRR